MSRNEWQTKFRGMPNSKKYWSIFKYRGDIIQQVELYYAHWLDFRKDSYFIEQMEDFVNRTRELRFKMDQHKEKREKMVNDLAFFIECVSERKVDPSMIKSSKKKSNSTIELGNCEATTPTPCVNPYCFGFTDGAVPQEKGNNPMRIENSAISTNITTKSDDAISREYLLSRLAIYVGWCSPKLTELSNLFNLDEDGRPKTYQQLIDVIKNDKFSLDDKAVRRLKLLEEDGVDIGDYGYGPFYGITFTDLPKADREGYDAAVKQFEVLFQTTKDTIMVKSPAEGLTALQALEAWTPTGKAN